MTRFLDRLARRALQVPPQVRAADGPLLQAGPLPENPWADPLAAEVMATPAMPGAPALAPRAVPLEVPPPAPPGSPGSSEPFEPFEPLEPLVHAAPVERAPAGAPREPPRSPAAEAFGADGVEALPAHASEPQSAAAPVPSAPATPAARTKTAPATRPPAAFETPAAPVWRSDTAAGSSMPPLVPRRAAADASIARAPVAAASEPEPADAPGRAAPAQAPHRPRNAVVQPALASRDTRRAEEATTTVQVTIGRIEIAAVAPPPAPVRVPAPGARPLSLDDYLARRSRR